MRRSIILTVSTTLALGLGTGTPSASSAERIDGSAFDAFAIDAQSQAATTYLYAAGDEENRIAGALAKVDKPENVNVIAAAYQRGFVAGYIYGSTLGGSQTAGSGGTGLFPEPPPGEADALAPGDKTESSWDGPVTAGSQGAVVDGRAHAKTADGPSGLGEFAFNHIAIPGQFSVEDGSSLARGGPRTGGLEAEGTSVLHGISIAGGVISIRSLYSRALATLPAKAGATAIGAGTTVVDGATVGGLPVEITSAGIRASDQNQGADQKAQLAQQIRQALAGAHIEDIRLLEASTSRARGGALTVDAGMLVIKYRDSGVAAANPEGFGGGGLGLGGAKVSLNAGPAGGTSAGPANETSSTPNEAGKGHPATTGNRQAVLYRLPAAVADRRRGSGS